MHVLDRPRILGVVVSLLVFLTVMTGPLRAQVFSGSLTGVVKDSSEAVIPGAKVTLTDMGKQYDYNATTDDVGRYLIRALPPSTYSLKVEVSGFNTYLQEGIVLTVNQSANVDIVLKVGASAQTVEVSGYAAALLSTQEASTGQELDRRMINDLPLLGRSVFDLATLAPGMTPAAGFVGGSINFVSNGSRNSTADILMDGTSATNFEQNSGILEPLYSPSVDSVQEFKVQQSNFSAEIGFSGSTIINMVIRSGTNQFHGSGWEFFRDNRLTANNWFNNSAGVPLGPRRENLFGGTIGGPIRKDKTFFFFNYEGDRNTSAGTYRFGVPSDAMKAGNFGEICAEGFDAEGHCLGEGQLWDPYSGSYDENVGGAVKSRFIPFNRLDLYESPGNPKLDGTIYQARSGAGNLIDPVAARMIQYFPKPNLNVGQANYNRHNNFLKAVSRTGRNDQWDLKIDHSFDENNRLSAKFSRGTSFSTSANVFGNPLDPVATAPSPGSSHMFTANYTHTISPSSLLNITFGFTRSYFSGSDLATAYPDYDPAKDLGFPDYIKTSGFKATPSVAMDQYATSGNANMGSIPWGIYRSAPETFHLAGSWSRLTGRHDIKIGGEGRMHRQNMDQPGEPAGTFWFDQNTTSEEPWYGGDSMASFLTGLGGESGWGEYEMPMVPATQSFRFAAYLQDNWKVTSKLTVNLGMRYDIETPRTERYNRQSYVDPTAASPLQVPGMPNLKGALKFVTAENRYNWGWDRNNWGPRFGFAYNVANKTVIRGGYGVFYQVTLRGAAGVGAYGFTGFDRYTPWITTFEYDGETPGARLSNPYPNGILRPLGSALGDMSYVGDSIHGPIKQQSATPYEQTWSLGIQHELGGGVVLDANYVGKKGTRLYFGGASSLNYLGPEIEKYTPDQVADLKTYVTNPFYGIVSDSSSLGGSPEVQKYQLLKPYPQFTGLDGIAPPVASSIYHALQVKLEKRFSHGLQFLTTYTWSKSIDDASITHGGLSWLGGRTSLQNPNNRHLERALSDWDMPHVLGFNYVYELPFGRNRMLGKNWSPVVEAVLGGWKTNGIWRFSSGQPLPLGLSGGVSLPTYGGQRPNLTGTLERNTGSDWRERYFSNPDVISTPEPNTIGNAPRALSSVRSPGVNNANLSVMKEFGMNALREGMRLEFRAEFFNAFNHPQFGPPDTTWDGGNFGAITYQQNSPREVQLALKFYW
jgi:hypothetical protein